MENLDKTIRALPLEDYQLKCLEFILRNKKCGVFLDIGYGKTLTTLAAIGILRPRNVLVVAPKAIARTTWHSEVRKWGLPYDCYSMIERPSKSGDKLVQMTQKELIPIYESIPGTRKGRISVFITTRDRIAHLADWCEKSGVWPFDMIVCDEFQSFKGGSTVRTKAVTKLAAHTERLVGLTGTPMPNSLEDIWSEIRILDGGRRLGRYISHFRDEYMRSTMVVNGHAVGWVPRPGASERVFSKISDIAISVRADLKLPPIRVNDIVIPLPPDAKEKYRSFLKSGVFDLSQIDPFVSAKISEEDVKITPQNAAVLAVRLLQMASGTIYDASHNVYEIHSQKISTAQYIIDNTGGSVLVAYHYKCDKDRLLSRLDPGDGNEIACFDGSERMKDEWNAGKYKIMLIQPASACHGINLQDGGSTLLWYSLPSSLEQYDQTIGRLYRKGQRQPVLIHRLIAEDTFDEKIASALASKGDWNAALLDAVRREVSAGA